MIRLRSFLGFTASCWTCAAFAVVILPAFFTSFAAAAMTHQVVLFTGFLSSPGTGTGMDLLNAELSTLGITNYEGQVFGWNDKQNAFDWVQQRQSDRASLVLIGHSFGGNSTLQLARDFLAPIGVDVDLTIQLDSVTNFGSGGNAQLPTNVDVGINYYQNSTGLFEPQGEDVVAGATNINVEVLFNDTSITHNSIDNDPRLHRLIGQNVLANLNLENADFDSNDIVNGADFLIWQRGFGAVGTGSLSSGDANGDFAVDEADLFHWQQQFGTVAIPQIFSQTVPEPSTWALCWCLAIAGVTACRANGRRPEHE